MKKASRRSTTSWRSVAAIVAIALLLLSSGEQAVMATTEGEGPK